MVDLTGRKILFLVTEDWYFCSHRLPVARAARDAGAEVVVATRVDRHRDAIEREGFRVIALDWRRRSRNPLRELAAIAAIVRCYRSERPDIVHHVAVKAAVYGGVAASLAAHPRQVAAIAGLGYVGTSSQLRARLLRPVVRALFRRVINRPETRVIVQNPDDERALVAGGLFDRDRVRVIRGSGVDVDRFHPGAPAGGPVVALLAGRMLWSKGVADAVEAARILAARGCAIRVVLAGDPDDENPESVGRERLRRWSDDGVVEWRGHVDDMPAAWRAAHIGLLPSYREGLPKTLLEAAACGLALVATDVPGCREAVRHEDNGLLVAPRSPQALAGALERLVSEPETRRRMGARSRERAASEFAEAIVVEATLALYEELLETS